MRTSEVVPKAVSEIFPALELISVTSTLPPFAVSVMLPPASISPCSRALWSTIARSAVMVTLPAAFTLFTRMSDAAPRAVRVIFPAVEWIFVTLTLPACAVTTIWPLASMSPGNCLSRTARPAVIVTLPAEAVIASTRISDAAPTAVSVRLPFVEVIVRTLMPPAFPSMVMLPWAVAAGTKPGSGSQSSIAAAAVIDRLPATALNCPERMRPPAPVLVSVTSCAVEVITSLRKSPATSVRLMSPLVSTSITPVPVTSVLARTLTRVSLAADCAAFSSIFPGVAIRPKS